MQITGLQKLTLLDFPERIACTVFISGCNLRCPFCHNAPLVITKPSESCLSELDLLFFLQSRIGILDGVCITGGEPTLHSELPDLIQKIRSLGFAVKLDTNGTNPSCLKTLLEDGLLDYVAMDIKNSPARYAQTCGDIDLLANVQESVKILMNSDIEFEFRTTVCHPLHTIADVRQIGVWLQGTSRYYFQQFIDSGNLIGRGLTPFSKTEMEEMRQAVLPWIPNTQIRGI